MKIAQISSWKVKCGIAVYALHLSRALKQLGHTCDTFPFDTPLEELLPKLKDYDIVHVQHEPILASSDYMAAILAAHPNVFITLHRPQADLMPKLHSARRLIVLRDFDMVPADRKQILPMGAPDYALKPRNELRDKYKYPQDAFIMTTFGFIVGWKQFDHLLNCLSGMVREHENVYLQFLTSYHFKFREESVAMHHTLLRIAEEEGIANRVKVLTDFIPDEEILDRISMSDLGILHAPIHTYSASAAAEYFVSARLPTIVSESSHFSNMWEYCWVGPMLAVDFSQQISTLLKADPNEYLKKKALMEERYKKTSWSVVGKRHEDLYKIFKR